MLVAFKTDSFDRAPHAFVDRVNDARRPASLVDRLDPEIHGNVGETFALIPVDDLLARFLKIIFIDRRVQFHSDFLAKLLRTYPLGAVNN